MIRVHLCSFVVRLFQIDDGRVAVKRKRAGASDSQVEQLAVMSVRAFEDNDLVGAGPAFASFRILSARPFNENLRAPADAVLKFLLSDFVHQIKQPAVTFFKYLLP